MKDILTGQSYTIVSMEVVSTILCVAAVCPGRFRLSDDSEDSSFSVLLLSLTPFSQSFPSVNEKPVSALKNAASVPKWKLADCVEENDTCSL